MTDVPSRLKAPENRISLAEMAAKAANKSSPPKSVGSTTGRVTAPASRSVPPATASATGRRPRPNALEGAAQRDGSGLIQFDSTRDVTSFAPAVQQLPSASAAPPPEAAPRTVRSPRPASSRFRGQLAGVLIAVGGLATAYGLAVAKGVDPVAAARNYLGSADARTPPSTPTPAHATSNPVSPAAQARATTTVAGPSAGASLPAQPLAAKPAEPVALAHGATPLTDPSDGKALRARPLHRPIERPAAAHPIAAAHAAAAPARPAAPTPPPEPSPPVNAAPTAPDPGGLAGAMKKAVGSSDTPAPTAAAQPEAQPMRGDIPEVPAQGAIQGALGGPRTAARSCLEDQTAPSRANIAFAPTGKVQSVSVTGPAAGTPAEACIRAALSQTTVGPFRRPSFSLTTTISPP